MSTAAERRGLAHACIVDSDELQVLLTLESVARDLRRKRDDHRARGGRDTNWAKTLPIGVVEPFDLVLDALDEVRAAVAARREGRTR